MGWVTWAAAMRMLTPTRKCGRATMPAEQDFPSPADDEEAGYQSFQDDQDDSIVLDSEFNAGCDLRRLQGSDCQSISAGAAEPMASHGCESYVDGLITLSNEVAKALSQQGGVLSFSGRTALSDEAAKALRANPENGLSEKFR